MLSLLLRILQGERYEKASLREWKWGVGGLGTLIGMATCSVPWMMNTPDTLSDTAVIVLVAIAIPILVVFMFCFSDIIPAVWSLGIGILGWLALVAAVPLVWFRVEVSVGLGQVGLGVFAGLSVLGLVLGLLGKKE